MPTSRIEAFSDGVFSIAITLLVLDFHLPNANTNLTRYLLHQWPSMLAYAISFLLIGLIWANHHSMFAHIKKADRRLMFLNVLLLANVAFLPFPTQLLADAMHHPDQLHAAAFFYGLLLTIGGIFFNAIWYYVTARRQLLTKLSEGYIRRTRRRFLIGPIAYATATIVSLLSPLAAIICYAGLIIYFWLPPADEARITRTE